MKKMTILAGLAIGVALSIPAFAANDAYPNGKSDIPGSSTAATPHQVEQSPGTVGAMKDADKGGFTASKTSQGAEHLKGNSAK